MKTPISQKLLARLRNMRNTWWTILFPERCIVCKKEGVSFCTSCRETLPRNGGFNYYGIFSLWEYGHPTIRRALHDLKYKNKRAIAKDIAESMSDTLLEHLAERVHFNNPIFSEQTESAFLIIPVPLSKKRLKTRGYNQAELLAKELSLKNHLSFVLETSVLYKIKDTESQVSVKDRTKRLENIRGSFAVKNPEKITGKNILLIDDITTTGATLNEARKVLLKAGAGRVYGVTVAH